MTTPQPKEGSVRYGKLHMGGKDVYEVYRNRKWQELDPDDVASALEAAPVISPRGESNNPSGEQIKLPPAENQNYK